LYRHRAMYRLAQYRQRVIAEGNAIGESIAWENTQPESIFAILYSLTPTSRSLTIESLISTPSMKEPLGLALQDLASGLRHNPLFGQLHSTAAALSPIVSLETKAWIARSAALAKSDPEKLYANGLLAFQSNAIDQMKDSWKSCLTVTGNHDAEILSMSLQKLPLAEVAGEMLPRFKPELLVNLIRIHLAGDQTVKQSTTARRTESRAIAERIESGSLVLDGHRAATAASIYELTEDRELAVKQWLAAVDAEPLNADYRWKAANGLRAIGKLDESLEQISLGRVLTPDHRPFDQLAERVRLEISTAGNALRDRSSIFKP
jgi:hypothetical protein